MDIVAIHLVDRSRGLISTFFAQDTRLPPSPSNNSLGFRRLKARVSKEKEDRYWIAGKDREDRIRDIWSVLRKLSKDLNYDKTQNTKKRTRF